MTPTRQFLLSRFRIVIEEGFYLDSDDGQPNPSHVYCYRHAYAVATRMERSPKSRARGTEFFVCGAWGGSDHEEWCAIKTCGVALNTGPLTDYGIDSALALTEEDPFSSPVSPEGLSLAADAMGDRDPRWTVWDRHLLTLLEAR